MDLFHVEFHDERIFNREPESKQMLDPFNRAWQKWQRVGCFSSGRAKVNKHCLYGPLESSDKN